MLEMANLVTSEDMSEAFQLLGEIKNKSAEVNNHLSSITRSIENGDIMTTKGISFLEMKNQMLLSYLVNLSHLMCDKIHGKTIREHPSTERLIEIRTVIEKIRPVDQKLKYQIDKLIKTATTGISENDPLKFRPNPDGLVSKLEDKDGESEEDVEDQDGAGTGVYRPPKLAAMHYDGDETVAVRQEKMMEKAKKRALSSSIMRELKDQYSEAPMEIKDDYNYHRVKEDKNRKEQQEYEEKYFLRMQVSKKQKHQSRQLRTMSGLNELTRFGDISGLSSKADDMSGAPAKRRKVSKKAKGKSASKKKRRFKHM